MSEETLRERARKLPRKPGVYLFKNASGEALYVGKANVLRNRVSSYFHRDLDGRIDRMVSEAVTVDYIVVGNELEALMLEANLIKQNRPQYNVMLRDDKSYPYLVITMADKYPRIAIMRRPRIKGAKLYGPYTAKALRKTVDFLRGIFPVCNCRTPEKGRNGRCPCLDYHIGRCMAPCMGIDPDEYREMVNELCMFLEGKRREIIKRLERQMAEAASNLEFERAAKIRDRLNSIQGMMQNQKAISAKIHDADIVGLASDATGSVIQLLSVRDGLLIDSKHFSLPWAPDEEVVRSFLLQYFSSGTPIPPEILVPLYLEEHEVIAEMLSTLRGTKVRIAHPVRGEKRQLLLMSNDNAEHSLAKRAVLESHTIMESQRIMGELQNALGLPGLPQRIECFDISTTSGVQSVGSMVLFVDGRAHKDGYRKFRIRKDPGLDDVGMMKEMLKRRFSRAGSEGKDIHFAKVPDLVVVDGGIGQTNAAASVLKELGLDDVPIIGLAKRLEEIYFPGESRRPLQLPKESGALRLLQQIRDEAHRFAITYHRSLRAQKMTRSALDQIPGVGPERRKKLLRHFSSTEELAGATEDDIIRVAGIPRQLAQDIIAHVRAEMSSPVEVADEDPSEKPAAEA